MRLLFRSRHLLSSHRIGFILLVSLSLFYFFYNFRTSSEFSTIGTGCSRFAIGFSFLKPFEAVFSVLAKSHIEILVLDPAVLQPWSRDSSISSLEISIFANQSDNLLTALQNDRKSIDWKIETIYQPDYRYFNLTHNGTLVLNHISIWIKSRYWLLISVLYNRQNFFWIGGIPSHSKFRPNLHYPMAMPKFEFIVFFVSECFMNFRRPADILRFKWLQKRSKFLECNWDTVVRPYYAQYGPQPAVNLTPYKEGLQEMMKISQNNLVTILISFGTLLGWYRQCDFLVKSIDFDFNIAQEDFSLQIFQKIWASRVLQPFVRFGNAQPGLEYRLVSNDNKWFDLFLMYKDRKNSTSKNQYWVYTVQYKNKQLWKGNFPDDGKVCSAELLQTLVYVPCDPLAIIQAEYDGNRWFNPNDDKHSNLHFRKKVSRQEMDQVYTHFFKKRCKKPHSILKGCD